MTYKIDIDWNDFLATYWQKKPVIIRQGFKQFVDPISPDELAGLALEEEIESRIVTNKEGQWEAKYGPFQHYDHLGETNWSLLVQAVDHWHSEAAQLVTPFKQFPQWLFEDLMISYATPLGGVGPHIDNYDVFIIQGMGKRRWKVGPRNPNYRQFTRHPALLHVEAYQPIIDEEISAGDILYIPMGFPHDGVCIETSLSYSIGFRSPYSQEMLSSFADYVLDTVNPDIYYDDPNLTFPQDPYLIKPYELNKLKGQLVDLVNNDTLFNDWFGKHITHSMHQLNIIEVEPPYQADEFLSQLDEAKILIRVPSIRLLKIAETGFINGERLELPLELLDLLCQHDEIELAFIRPFLQDEACLTEMIRLVNKGYWYFPE